VHLVDVLRVRLDDAADPICRSVHLLGKTLIVSDRPPYEGRIERFMLWADDEFGFYFTGLLIALALGALGGLVLLAQWLF